MLQNISQILITKSPEPISKTIKYSTQTIKNNFSKCSYKLYSNDSIIELITKHFDKNVLSSYLMLKPYAYKKDLAEYCILFLKGGWYFDLTIKALTSVDFDDNLDFLAFRDCGEGLKSSVLPYPLQTSILYSKPKNLILERSIELIIENCRSNNYGFTPTCPTGPGLLGRAYAQLGMKSTHCIGIFQPLTPFHEKLNQSYLLPDGTVFALHKTAWTSGSKPADIRQFGFKGTNNYLQMYYDNNIYDASIDI